MHILLVLTAWYLWAYCTILLHEMAHLLVGRAVGFTPHEVYIGTGEGRWRFTAFGLKFEIGPWPYGGLAMAHLPRKPGLRWRGALFAIAGPVADALLLGCLFFLQRYLRTLPFDDRLVITLAPLQGFLIAMQGLTLLYNLVPHDTTWYGSAIPNDGKQIWLYLTGKCVAGVLTLEDRYIRPVQRYDPDFAIENSWMSQADAALLEVWLAAGRAETAGDYVETVAKYDVLLQEPSVRGGERAMMLDHLACMAVMEGRDELLPRALVWAREACALFPGTATLRGTLGGALVQTGRHAEGIEMLTPLTTEGNEAIDRGIASLFLAKAWDRQGDPAQAAAWLAKSRELGGFEKLRQRLTADLSAETVARAAKAAPQRM